uniref:Uncharacterized protein n=1 Tax=Tanacetum cinerariifolium TaxID=118510 RepID=A0A6L2M5N5_TANCI|nr:hypothetical protein [Tanacetum cinerariifolium]
MVEVYYLGGFGGGLLEKKEGKKAATIREALCLDDAEGVDCLPNEEIFTELAKMGYEKPSTKLTFYKAFFSSQWKLMKKEMQMSMLKKLLLVMLLKEMIVLLMEKFLLLLKNHPFHLLHHLLHHHNHLKTFFQLPRRVEHLEFDKVAQALEITKLKRRVKKLERRNKVRVLKLRRLQKVRTSQRVETSDDTVMDDEYDHGRMIAKMDQDDVVVLEDDKENREVADKAKEIAEDAKVDENVDTQGRTAESQAKIYKIDMDHANKVLSMQEDETEPAEVQEVVDVVTTAKLITEVVTTTSETVTAAIIRDHEEESTTSTIIHAETKSKDKAIDHVKRKAKEDPAIKRYHLLKRKPYTEAQDRKNMMVYLNNVAGYKMDYFKGMSYDDICPIFERYFDSNVAFLIKSKEQLKEEENKALISINETPAEKAAKRQKLNEEVLVVDYKIIELNNKPHYKIIRAYDTHQFKGQRMEATGIMWCADHNVYIYSADFVSGEELPLIRFTLNQMLNAVRLEVEEESEMSLEFLRFTRQQHQEGQLE